MMLTVVCLAALLFAAAKAIKHQNTQAQSLQTKPHEAVQAAKEIRPATIIAAEQRGDQIIVRGLGMPGASLGLFTGGKTIAGGRVNREGGWVMTADRLLEGETPQILDIVMRVKDKEVRSEQQLIVMGLPPNEEVSEEVPSSESLRPLLLLVAPGTSSRVLTSPYGTLPSRDGFELEAIDYDDSGGVIFSGHSKYPGKVQIYAGGTLVGESHVDQTGRWSLIFGNIMPVGEYDITAELVRSDGQKTRLALLFQRTKPDRKERVSEDQIVVKPQEDRTLVRRQLLGGGHQYTLIFSPEALIGE